MYRGNATYATDTMQLNYVILCHNNPQHLARLVSRLNFKDARFYIHVDKKADIGLFQIAELQNERVKFIPDSSRVHICWGHISMVEATLLCMEMVLKDNRSGYVALLSGQDYPIKTPQHINEFFEHDNEQVHISKFKLPSPRWPGNGMKRVEKHSVFLPSIRGAVITFDHLLSREFREELARFRKAYGTKSALMLMVACLGQIPQILFKKEKYKGLKDYYGGDQWWAMPVSTVRFMFDFLQSNPGFYTHFKTVLVPDEIFFQTLLLNYYPFPEKIKESLTFVDWSGPQPPKVLDISSRNSLKSSNQLFARKMAPEVSKELLDLIDREAL